MVAFAATIASAGAQLTVSPLRQVITPGQPVVVYRVSNASNRIIEGRVSWIDLKATEAGYATATAAERDRMSAAPYLAVWPATFRLEPGGVAAVTVRLRKERQPPAGERRSHLLFQTEAVRTPLRRAGGDLELDVGLGISTPVLIRGAGLDARATIGETRLLRAADGSLEIETHVSAESAATPYGAIEFYLGEPGAKPRLIARAANVSAFIDAPRRRVTAALGVEQLPAGDFEIRFVGDAEYRGQVFARRRFEIAPAASP
jgi:P pilus assembly chaperone PapD